MNEVKDNTAKCIWCLATTYRNSARKIGWRKNGGVSNPDGNWVCPECVIQEKLSLTLNLTKECMNKIKRIAEDVPLTVYCRRVILQKLKEII